MDGVLDLFPEPQKQGIAEISHYVFDEHRDPLYNLRSLRDDGGLTYMLPGKYVRLHVNGELMMSDTRMEKATNSAFIRAAKGRVLIAGLGIGLILKQIFRPERHIGAKVTSVVVIEKFQDVINLVGPKFNDPRLKIICADINTWLPVDGTQFDTIYFDIWPEICTDNYAEIKALHRRYRKWLAPNGWMDSWMREFLIKEIRKDKREARQWRDLFGRHQKLNDSLDQAFKDEHNIL